MDLKQSGVHGFLHCPSVFGYFASDCCFALWAHVYGEVCGEVHRGDIEQALADYIERDVVADWFDAWWRRFVAPTLL